MHSTRRLVPALLGLILMTSQPLAAQEWTRFRGPNGTGISNAKTIPTEWTDQDINWKVPLPANGHSSPVLWGDKIFLTGADDQTTALRVVFCLDASDGKVLWSRRYESRPHKKHKFNSYASATPAVDAEHVYVAWSTPEEYSLIALDHAGEEVWNRDLGPFLSQHSCGTSPIVYKDLVIIGNDQDARSEEDENVEGRSFLIAVNRKTGETVWQVERKSNVVAYSTPMVYRPEGGKDELIFNSSAHGITSIDPETGSVNWEVGGLLTKRSCSSPILVGGRLITASCGSGGGGNYIVVVQPASKSAPDSGKLVYKVDKQAPYVPTPIAKGNLLFLWADNGIVTCLDANSGSIHWRERIGGNVFSSPIIVDDRLFGISTEGEVVVIAAKPEFELLARNPLNELCHATPAVANGRMYVRTYGHLYSIGGSK